MFRNLVVSISRVIPLPFSFSLSRPGGHLVLRHLRQWDNEGELVSLLNEKDEDKVLFDDFDSTSRHFRVVLDTRVKTYLPHSFLEDESISRTTGTYI